MLDKQNKNQITLENIFQLMLFFYPLSLAAGKSFNNLASLLLLFTSFACIVKFRHRMKSITPRLRISWVACLCLPLMLAVVQAIFLSPRLALRDFDDISRFFFCIPIYIAILLARPNVRLFLWGCVIFIVYTLLLFFWHMHIAGLERGIAPNGFLGIIPHTSIAIILGAMALNLKECRSRIVSLPILALLLGLATLAIPLVSQTRSGLLLACAMGFLLWTLQPCRNLKVLAYGVACIGLIVLLISGSNRLWTRNDNTLSEIVEYSERDRPVLTSATTRIELWRAAGKMFIDHPIIGVGNHRFRSTLSEYKQQGKASPQLDLYSHPHNEILKDAAEGGSLGLLSLALLYFVPLIIGCRAYRHKNPSPNPILLLLFLSGFLIAGLVDVILAWHSVIMFYSITTSLLIANVDSETVPTHSPMVIAA